MKKVVIASATVVGKSQPLDANELAHACGAEVEWVARLVEVGIVSAAGDRREEWRFHSLDLRRAREARRLERDFDAGLDAVALILDLSQEVRRLKAQLRALGATRVGAGQEPTCSQVRWSTEATHGVCGGFSRMTRVQQRRAERREVGHIARDDDHAMYQCRRRDQRIPFGSPVRHMQGGAAPRDLDVCRQYLGGESAHHATVHPGAQHDALSWILAFRALNPDFEFHDGDGGQEQGRRVHIGYPCRNLGVTWPAPALRSSETTLVSSTYLIGRGWLEHEFQTGRIEFDVFDAGHGQCLGDGLPPWRLAGQRL